MTSVVCHADMSLNNNKSFIFPQIRVTMTGIEFLRSDFTEYSVHEHTTVNSLGRGSVPYIVPVLDAVWLEEWTAGYDR